MNQTCLITGATDGIGKQTALELAHKNYSLVLIGRNLEKGESVVSELIRKTGNEFIQFYCADMSSMKAVKALAIKIAKMLFAIDIVKGARTSVYLSSSDDVAGISGKYFDKCKVVQSSKASYIEEDQKKLWEATEELIDSLQIN